MTDIELQPLSRSVSLKVRVVEHLRDAILFGRYEPGARLIEKDLSKPLEASRSLLCEALQYLEAEGLIVSVVHRGPSVATVCAEDARKIYRIREHPEAMATEDFDTRASDTKIRELRDRLDEFEALIESGSFESISRTKAKFYETLLEGSENEFVSQLLRISYNRARLLGNWTLAEGSIAQDPVLAIEERDAPAAARLSAMHVRKAGELVKQHFAASVRQ